jgi:pimeloyl-ACP methyl ester carboxylesterase
MNRKSTQKIVVLHGWQSRIQRWDQFKTEMEKNNWQVFLPQLPGFGNNRLTKSWNLGDYLNWFDIYLRENKINSFCLLGHSFGGRLAIKYAAKHPQELKKLVLVNSAGLEKKLTFKKAIFWIAAKLGKIFFCLPPFCLLKNGAQWLLYRLARERDYYQADDNLKKTMTAVISENVEKELNKVNIVTLIVWGAKDRATPLKWATVLKSGIAKSKLLVYDNIKHDLPFTKSKQLASDVIRFCQNN